MTWRALAWLCLTVAVPAYAAGPAHDAHGHGAAPHVIPWATLFFTVVNFLLFVWILSRYVWPQVRLWLRERHTSLVEELKAATEARHEAERLRSQWAERLSHLGEEIERLRREMHLTLEEERQRVLQEAQRAAEAIRRDAERQAAAELRQLKEELRAHLLREAEEVAVALVRQRWTGADQQRAVEEFLAQVRS